jgi:hypothetical protein
VPVLHVVGQRSSSGRRCRVGRASCPLSRVPLGAAEVRTSATDPER